VREHRRVIAGGSGGSRVSMLTAARHRDVAALVFRSGASDVHHTRATSEAVAAAGADAADLGRRIARPSGAAPRQRTRIGTDE
jgi:pimeloyl-ACP methyl ester carboxylesterase